MTKTYTFNYLECCYMCGNTTQDSKIMGKRLNRSQGRNPSKKVGISTTILKCKKCDLVYSNPIPIPQSIQDHYGIPPENYWNKSYFSLDENYFKSEIEKLKTLLDYKQGMTSLDIGAGLGKAMISLEKAGFNSFGFEPSEPFYDRAISIMGVNKDKLKLGMIEDVDYPSNSFDFITFGAVLEHLYNPSFSIKKALDWLKPNGIIHIEVPSSDWLIHDLVNFYYKMTGTDYVANLSPMHEPFHLYEFSLKSFLEFSKNNNCELVNHDYFVCETYLPKVLDFIIKPIMKFTNKGMQLTVWLKKNNSLI